MTDQPLSLSTLQAELSALELRIVDRLGAALEAKADKVHLEQLETRVASLELSRAAREKLPTEILEQEKRLNKLERFRYAFPSVSLLSLGVAFGTLLVYWHGLS